MFWQTFSRGALVFLALGARPLQLACACPGVRDEPFAAPITVHCREMYIYIYTHTYKYIFIYISQVLMPIMYQPQFTFLLKKNNSTTSMQEHQSWRKVFLLKFVIGSNSTSFRSREHETNPICFQVLVLVSWQSLTMLVISGQLI